MKPAIRNLALAVTLLTVHLVQGVPLKEYLEQHPYKSEISTVKELIGFEIGERALTHNQIVQCLETWEMESDRFILRSQGHSHEGRSLNHLIISQPGTLQNIDSIQKQLQALSDPRLLSPSQAIELENLPTVALYSYNIHGDECSSADGAVLFIYHLIASESDEVAEYLKNNIIIVNPLQNPDGRDRYLKMIAEGRSDNANGDDQDLIPRGYWSRGRTNHYYFDLNRDWLFGIHPETRGLMKVFREWNPLMLVDGHEMYPQETFLFSPPVAPINPNRPHSLMGKGITFAQEQAAAFDENGLLYYTGEWDEEWYPGYTTSWSALRGSLPILYEQARVTEGRIAHANGTSTTYRDSVEHQFLSSITNLHSFNQYRDELREEYLALKKDAVSASGKYAQRAFILPPTNNTGRLERLLDTLAQQGIEAYQTTAPVKLENLSSQLGKEVKSKTFEAGSIVIPCRQPLANLVSAMFEFDPAFPEGPARNEREKLLSEGRSNIYDLTAWNLSMTYDLETYESNSFSIDLSELTKIEEIPTITANSLQPALAYAVNGQDDKSVFFAAQLMEAGLEVRMLTKDAQFAENSYAPGSIFVMQADNSTTDDLTDKVQKIATKLNIQVDALHSGKALSESRDMGGDHYKLLERPRVAMLTRGNTHLYSVGSTWYLIDKILSIPHSLLNEERLLAGVKLDLRRYNVIIIPERRGIFPPNLLGALKAWVKEGGTLIAMGSAVAPFISEEEGFANTRLYKDALENLDEYELDVERSFQAASGVFPDYSSLLQHSIPEGISYPTAISSETKRPSKEKLTRKEDWQQLFAPSGAILAGRVNSKHWLTFGLGDYLPILAGRNPLMMSKLPVETPVRMGVYQKTETAQNGEEKETNPSSRIGWARIPAGHEMNLRMSGLLWPEAAERVANSSYLTRESIGKGQIILFANNPTFRNSTLGTSRLLMNAIIYGPGAGTTPKIDVF